MKNKYETVIGLEIHVQLKTKSKMFCSCDNSGENQPPNTTICPVCMGHPGVLPVINRQALEWTVLAGLALDGEIAENTHFDRKSYFYPDLPKGYQISQYSDPIVKSGWLETEGRFDGKNWEKKKIRLERIHLEEDAAKLVHAPTGETFVDYNRAGTPLMEIVTRPDLRSPEEAKIFLQELRLIMRYLGISGADMEKGHLRCDANISLRETGSDKLNPKTEIKNLNSFRAVERALQFEIKRQIELWNEGRLITVQSTRGWDEAKQKTVEQRTKEEAHDYRYFPEPDLPQIRIKNPASVKTMAGKQESRINDDETVIDLEVISRKLRELPQAKRKRFADEYALDAGDAKILTDHQDLSYFFEQVISELRAWLSSKGEAEGTEEEIWQNNKKRLSKLAANWIINRFLKLLGDGEVLIRNSKITSENFAELLIFIEQNKINSTTAQVVLEEMIKSGRSPESIISEQSLEQVSDESAVAAAVEKAVSENPKVVADYKSGKIQAAKFLLGMVMKEMKGKANPQVIQKILGEKLGEA